MTFRLGTVGHKETLQKVSDLVKEYFDDIVVYPEEFGNDNIIADAVERIAALQTVCDGILYSRRDPYLLISGRLQHTIPVRYVEIDRSHLLISLLKAHIHYGFSPTSISIDSFDRATAAEALQSVGIPMDNFTIRTVTADPSHEGMVNDSLVQHLKHWKEGAQLCVTNITDVHVSLLNKGIPSAIISPTVESFVHEIRNLRLRHRLMNQNSCPLAVVNIRLRYKDRYRFYGDMPIREIDEISKAAKLMTVFAEKVDGAMFCLSRWEYLILCGRLLLQNATDRFIDFRLMQDINRETAFDVTVGVGCGQTIKEAQSNAVFALNRTSTQKGTSAVVALSATEFIGPISPKSEHFPENCSTETRLDGVAQATGLSISTINLLYQATRTRNSNLFTSAELARALGVTVRTANRIVERLTDHSYASIDGKSWAAPRGRPARVIRLLF